MRIRLFNTYGRELQAFTPISEGQVGMYACGPTVYKFAHIGNLRAYVFEDLLRRSLEYAGFTVRHVMNVTDVGHLSDDADEGEDKMLRSAREQGMTVWEIADFYTSAFFRDTDLLNIERPTVVCRATEHIGEMIGLVKRLEDRGFTYQSAGNVYFDIEKFPDYGKLALLDRQELRAGARIEVDEHKHNPRDFVLWFTNSKFEHQAMTWESPWGTGYPGWHLECSAMSMKYLGEHFDIHCGGVDHIPVHHTNEIAQSEASTGKKWVNYWLHNEFVLMNDKKMAKSSGGFVTLSDLMERGYDPLDFRYLCLGTHYRTQLQYTIEALDGARAARLNLLERVSRLSDEAAPVGPSDLSDRARFYLAEFEEGVSNDLGLPKCLAAVWNLLKEPSLPDTERLTLILEMDRVLGLRLAESRHRDSEIDEEAKELVRKRDEARRMKDFRRADEIREILLSRGIILEDSPSGTKIYKKGN
ncbi:MAG TPA: cysteine--tRNA ligase [Spirochaetia bacterium]|nr:cysteine--tRNA ligase [Spirochaetia bacterium]